MCLVIVCGDFNVHVDKSDDIYTVQLAQLLLTFNCIQHVAELTHTAGHTLDLVITRTDTNITDLRVGGFISDHVLIRFTMPAKTPSTVPSLVACKLRPWRRLSRDQFAADLAESKLCTNLDDLCDCDVDAMAHLYDDLMTRLLDQHCPVVYVRRRIKPIPWFDLTAVPPGDV